MQAEPLNSPVHQFSREDPVGIVAIDFMHRPKLLPQLSGAPELPQNRNYQSLVRLVPGRLRMQSKLLHSPVGEFRGENLVRIATVDLMHGSEFLQQLAGAPEFPQNGSVQLHFVDFAVIHGRAWV